MKLRDLYPCNHWEIPFRLLQEREPHQNISHREMPTWEQHCAFMRSRPYIAWYWFTSPAEFDAGCVYLSKQREIGVGVLKAHRGQRLAGEAIRELMLLHPGTFIANFNPANAPSLKLFHSLGFTRPVQVTYAHE